MSSYANRSVILKHTYILCVEKQTYIEVNCTLEERKKTHTRSKKCIKKVTCVNARNIIKKTLWTELESANHPVKNIFVGFVSLLMHFLCN